MVIMKTMSEGTLFTRLRVVARLRVAESSGVQYRQCDAAIHLIFSC